MKYLYVFVVCIGMMSCNPNETIVDEIVTACGVRQPQENLPWLKEMIMKAETDKTGNYWGTIWLVKYKGLDIFVNNMMLGSGGVLYWIFDCSGNHFISKNGEGYCPSDFVGNGHAFIEDEDDFFSFMLNMNLEENKDGTVIYSTFPL
jgi:hypothetical protein